MREKTTLAAVSLVVVIVICTLSWQSGPSEPEHAPTMPGSSSTTGWKPLALWEGGSPNLVVNTGYGVANSSGFENFFIMRHDSGYNRYTELSVYKNNTDYWFATYNPTEGWVGSIPYEIAFDIVWAARMETQDYDPVNYFAYVCRENMKVELGLSNAFNYLENSTNEMEYVFENLNYYSPSGWLRANIVFDNGGNGWVLKAGESWNFTGTLWAWG